MFLPRLDTHGMAWRGVILTDEEEDELLVLTWVTTIGMVCAFIYLFRKKII